MFCSVRYYGNSSRQERKEYAIGWELNCCLLLPEKNPEQIRYFLQNAFFVTKVIFLFKRIE
jgi:hypothetical protein